MKTSATEISKRRTYVLRPFQGRNSDTDALNIRPGEASGGTNWYSRGGVIYRRPSMSRLGIRLSLGPGSATAEWHAIVPDMATTDIGNTLRTRGMKIVGNVGILQLASPEIDPTNLDYNEGTITLTSGSTTVSGTGTSWLSRGIHPGAVLTQGSNTYTVRSINSNTSLTLTSAPSATASGVSYRLSRYMLNRHPGVQNEYVYPDLAYIMATETCSVTGGSTIRTTAGTFAAGSLITGVEQGRRYIEVAQGLYNYFGSTDHPAWLYMPNDVGTEATGYSPVATRRAYKFVGRETVDGVPRIYLHERFRGTVGAGSGGAYIIPGWHITDSGFNLAREIPDTVSGTLTVVQGSTSITGSGTSFSAGSALAEGDIVTIKNREYEVTSVASDTSLTVRNPVDQASASGQSYEITYPTAPYTPPSNVNETLANGTSYACRNGFGRFFTYPMLYRPSVTPTYRIQAVRGVAPRIMVDGIASTDPEYLFVSSPELNVSKKHGIYWNLPFGDFGGIVRTLTREILPVSTVAPQARHIEFWNGRLFAADLMEIEGTVYSTRPLRLRWTRPNEPYSWWNQYATDGAGFSDQMTGEGPISAVKTLGGIAIVVYRRKGATVLSATGDAINPFSLSHHPDLIGPVSKESILDTPEGHMYLSQSGEFAVFNGNRDVNFPCPLTQHIRDNMSRGFERWTMAIHNEQTGEYMWFIPTANSRRLTQAIVFRIEDGSWYVYDFTGNPLSCVGYVRAIDTSTERRVFAVDQNNNLLAFRYPEDGGTGFDFTASVGGGTLFTTQWESGDIALPVGDQNSEEREKLVDSVEILYDANPNYGGVLAIEVSGNGGETYSSFGNVSLRPGTVTGLRSTLAGGDAMVKSVYHRFRLTQTPASTALNTAMAVRAIKVNYTDQGETTP